MPQQFLHYPYIRTPFNQVSSKLVPQSVGVQVIKASGQRCERVTFCSVIITKFCELYNSSFCYHYYTIWTFVQTVADAVK